MSFPIHCTENEIGGKVPCVGERKNTKILQKDLRKQTVRDIWSIWEDNNEMDST